MYDESNRRAACGRTVQEIDKIWNDDASAAAKAGVVEADPGQGLEIWERTVPWLDRYAAALKIASVQVCTTVTVDQRWGSETAARADRCLESARGSLGRFLVRLAEATKVDAQNAITQAASLPRPNLCANESALNGLASPPPPEIRDVVLRIQGQLSDATYQRASGDVEGGLATARAARELAETTAWEPVIATSLNAEALSLYALARNARPRSDSSTRT